MAEYPALDVPCDDPDSPLSDRLCALLDDFDPLGLLVVDAGLRVFFRSGPMRDQARQAIADREGLNAVAIEVSDEDWARRSQDDLRAIEAGGLVIAPPWDVPKGATPVIIIEPSMGFGTGHHATTRLCLRMLRRLAGSERAGEPSPLRGARVLDVGTGSGVLALAAWKLGAGDVVGVDNDPDALQNARENIARNGAGPSIDIVQDDLGSLRIERAGIVLANLTGAVLVRYADELRGLVLDGGHLILSGFAPQDTVVVRSAFRDLAVIDEQSEGDWASLMLRRT
ncbi:MAG TPA: 50S ribosomal protein L11 methyltransferase [Vicinamibacterales bacterium]